MFGILRPCRHTLPGDLAAAWMSHLCGLCLALRDGHGQLARVATNYDGLVISVLAAAQSPESSTRAAGPCPLRGMRRADVADGQGTRLAASVSLLLAAAKIGDHIDDGDGAYARRPVRAAARGLAGRWERRARAGGDGLGFDGGVLVTALDEQADAESAAERDGDILAATRPTEFATGEAFAHTAVLAQRPENREPLREAGRLFGRIAHLLDAVEDRAADRAAGAWNPITATGTEVEEVRRLCEDAVWGVELALGESGFHDDRLVHALLVDELRRSVTRTFAAAGYPGARGRRDGHSHGDRHWRGHHSGHGYGYGHPAGHGGGQRWPRDHDYTSPYDANEPPNGGDGPYNGYRALGDQGGSRCNCKCETPKIYEPPKKRGFFAGCGVALFMCCTGQCCFRDPQPGAWTGKRNESCCDGCDGCDCGCGGGSGGGGGGGDGCCCDCNCCCCCD